MDYQYWSTLQINAAIGTFQYAQSKTECPYEWTRLQQGIDAMIDLQEKE